MTTETFEVVTADFEPIPGYRYFVESLVDDVTATIGASVMLPGEVITLSNSNVTPTLVKVVAPTYDMVGDLDTVYAGEELVIELGQYARLVCVTPTQIQLVQP